MVLTDNNPLTYVLTSAKLDAAGHRWLAALSTFRVSIKYRAGHANGDADGLSRRPQAAPHEDDEFLQEKERISEMSKRILEGEDCELPAGAVSAVCQHHAVALSQLPIIAESLAVEAHSMPELFVGQPTLPGMTKETWRKAQREDPSLGRVITLMEKAQKPHFKAIISEQPEVKLLLREWNKLELKEGILYRKSFDRGDEVYQLVLPEQYRSRALEGLHDEIGHLGPERVLSLARARVYWPRMKASVEKKCQACERCFRRKAQPQRAAPMVNIKTTYPLELVCMDYLSIEPDNRDTRNILVITDHFTKFAVAVPTKDQKAKTVAKALWENFLVYYGFPSRLHSDQGRDFESQTIKELCSLIGAEKVRTTPYHPQGNPVERFNRTLLSMLGTLEEKDKCHWRDFVKPLVHAYNCTRNDTTGYSPYELMFGRQPTLPVDLALGINSPNESHGTHSEYVQNLRQRLQESYALAAENARKSGERNKFRFDSKVRAAELMEGDHVLVRNVSIRGKHKLADRWERAIHVVVKRIKDGPVYVVRPVTGSGPHRTLHRDLLLPCGFLTVDVSPEADSGTEEPKRRNLRRRNVQEEDEDLEDYLGDEEEGYFLDRGVEVVSRCPVIQPVANDTRGQAQSVLNPLTPEFTPQSPRAWVGEPQPGCPNEPSDAVADFHRAVRNHHALSPDHVIIDIPEVDRQASSPQSEAQVPVLVTVPEPDQRHDVQSELELHDVAGQSVLRRSTRDRRPPHKFTYDELGKPLILAISSFFDRLQNVLPQFQIEPYQCSCRHLHACRD
uniref:Gypsy retrotransposon integrase-like protein 1 n=1 Tax=Monopterus albus TaxID=43700 RepID=A0A3Q3JNV5_MONAL